MVETIKIYEDDCNTRDVSKFKEVLALEDPRFTEIEDHIAEAFGAKVARDILQYIETHPDGESRAHYTDIRPFRLSEDTGYAIGVYDWTNGEASGKTRFTFIMTRYEDRWKIVHGHWSEYKE